MKAALGGCLPMAKKNRFPPEADTQPGASSRSPAARTSGPAPKSKRERSEVPTLPPPPKSKRGKPAEPKSSGIKSRRPRAPGATGEGGASVDEVVADLTKDPRRERE
jgi:hypothetical protein